MSTKKGSNAIKTVLYKIKNEIKKVSRDIGETVGNWGEYGIQNITKDIRNNEMERSRLQEELNKYLAIKAYYNEILKEINEDLEPSLKELKSKEEETGINLNKEKLFILYKFKAKMLAKVTICVCSDNKSSDEEKKNIIEKIRKDLIIMSTIDNGERKEEILGSYCDELERYYKEKNNIKETVNMLPEVSAKDAYAYYDDAIKDYAKKSGIEMEEL